MPAAELSQQDLGQEATEKLASLGLSVEDFPFPVDQAKCFPKLSGMGWKGDVKRRHKLLVNCQVQLQKTLKQEEEVLYIGRGVQQKFAEQYFLGIWAAFINQTVFVFTNLRVVLLNSDTKGNPKHTFWSIFYSEIAKFKGSMFGNAKLTLRDGSKFSYGNFKGIDRKTIPNIVQEARAEYETLGFTPTSTQSRENLCSNCVEVVPKDQYDCDNCGQKFYTPMQLALRSLVFPSWGDFCMKHTMLAVVELLGYVISWVFLLVVVFAAFSDGGADATLTAIIFFCLIVMEHVGDAILTYYIAKKGLSPRG